MGDMYKYENNNNSICSSSSTAHDHCPPSDDISLLLHQILLHSSSSSYSSFMTDTGGPQSQSLLALPSVLPENSNRPLISGVDLADGANETDECDCESEEGLEALVDEEAAKPAPPRKSSKRSRAAEVHNLSEKRRRSRINEKMKALQNLIPNSNKTDKASMLDEAIEYLKQLQLQVQMLALRNGMNLHPVCLPGLLQPLQLSQLRTGLGEENGSQLINMTAPLPLNQETSSQTMFGLPSHCTASNQPSVPNMSNLINSETSFDLESSIQAHFGPFPLYNSSEEICREEVLPHQQLNANHSERNPTEFQMEDTATVSLPFETQASNLKDSSSLEACMTGSNESGGVLLGNTVHNPMHSPELYGSTQTGRRAPNAEIKLERLDI